MNIEKLKIAAKKIDKLAQKQEDRTEAWRLLAKDARNPEIDRKEIERRKRELDASVVVDFGSAINELRAALRAR